MKIHELIIDKASLKEKQRGLKSWEILKNDNTVQVGDCLILHTGNTKDAIMQTVETIHSIPCASNEYVIASGYTHICLIHNQCYVIDCFGYCEEEDWNKTFELLINGEKYILNETGIDFDTFKNMLVKADEEYIEKISCHRYRSTNISIRDFNAELFERLYQHMLKNNAITVYEDEYGKLTHEFTIDPHYC